jgi:hypothetical protein
LIFELYEVAECTACGIDASKLLRLPLTNILLSVDLDEKKEVECQSDALITVSKPRKMLPLMSREGEHLADIMHSLALTTTDMVKMGAW